MHIGTVGHLAIDGDLVQGRDLGVVQLLSAEHALLTHDIFSGVEHDFVQGDIVAIPIQIAFLNNDATVKRPLGQFERAVAHDVGDPGPRRVAVRHLAELK